MTAMTVEITVPLALGLFSALSSMFLATWALSRRSRDWDKAEQLEVVVITGDPKTGKKSIVRELEDLRDHDLPEIRNALNETVRQLKILKLALNAHGSDEHVVVEAVERMIQSAAQQAASAEYEKRRREAQRMRKLIIEEQNERLNTGPLQAPRSFPALDVDSSTDSDDASTPRRKR